MIANDKKTWDLKIAQWKFKLFKKNLTEKMKPDFYRLLNFYTKLERVRNSKLFQLTSSKTAADVKKKRTQKM